MAEAVLVNPIIRTRFSQVICYATAYSAVIITSSIFFSFYFHAPLPDGLAVRPTPPIHRRIFDCFLYHNEAYMLYLHLATLSGLVDHFILGFCNESFTNRAFSPISYDPFEREIMAFSDSIYFLYIDLNVIPLTHSMYLNETVWKREAAARNHLLEGVKHFSPDADDLILLCDVDEIVTRSAISLIRYHPPSHYYNLYGHLFHYSYRWKVGVWERPMVIRFGSIRLPLDDYKFLPFLHELPGVLHYHCSFCFPTMKGIMKKLQSFSHTEYSGAAFTNPNYIYGRIACGYGVIPPRYQMPETLTPWEFDEDSVFLPSDPRLAFYRMRIGFVDLEEFEMNVSEVKRLMPKPCLSSFGRNLEEITRVE
jgi:beta-1,4-mannosyl-glycoprotein beta-1,4-N-acetylglucosaminyltransferase